MGSLTTPGRERSRVIPVRASRNLALPEVLIILTGVAIWQATQGDASTLRVVTFAAVLLGGMLWMASLSSQVLGLRRWESPTPAATSRPREGIPLPRLNPRSMTVIGVTLRHLHTNSSSRPGRETLAQPGTIAAGESTVTSTPRRLSPAARWPPSRPSPGP